MLLAALDVGSRGGDHGPRFLLPLLLLVLIGLLIGKIVRHRRGGPGSHGRRSALALLEERFARGEIDRSEFDHRKAVLDGADDIPPAPARPAQPASPPHDSASEPTQVDTAKDVDDDE